MSDTLGSSFIRQAQAALTAAPGLSHQWHLEDRAHGTLRFPAEPAGFEITVEVEPEEITVFAGEAHDHFRHLSPSDDIQTIAAEALGFVRDLLSPDMRVRVLLAADRVYRTHIERCHGNRWVIESTTGSLFWNYFGKRSEQVYQNQRLPGRLSG
jgi:hypothetical protein